jgi:hypothetical protein
MVLVCCAPQRFDLDGEEAMPQTPLMARPRFARGASGAAVIALGLMLCACHDMTDRADRANSVIMKAQVSLMQAADAARADVEARAAEEAAASVASARHDAIDADSMVKGGGPAVDLGDRYATRREADGSWAVYEIATGKTVRRDASDEPLGRDQAKGLAAALNHAGSNVR